MRAIKDQAYQLFIYTDKLLDYDQHVTLILSTSTDYDSQCVSVSARSTIKVCRTELGGSDFAIDSLSTVTDDVDYDIDVSAATLLTNMTNHGNYNPDS